jgi:Rrf2 family transcriptional regulator, iron-sulfur cluster assembly transcription factor
VQFSLSIEYAIHGLVYLASAGSDAATMVSDIARATSVPESYLRKVFQQLAKAGLVASHRGVKGGFSLGRVPAEITLKDVVEAIDGSLPAYTCLKAARGCSLDEACPVSSAFDAAREKMAEVLDATSIRDLARGIQKRSTSWLKVTECA